YDFQVNDVSVSSGPSNIWSSSTLNGGDRVKVIITTASGCFAESNELTINVDAVPSAAVAGVDLHQCDNDTFTMGATAPVTGTGEWSIVTGSATLGNINDPAMTVTNVAAGTAVVLRWTVSNGVCASSSDDVLIRNHAPPSDAVAGVDISQYGNGTFTVTATNAAVGVGQWSVVAPDPGVTIANPNSYTTTVSGLPAGESVTLRWTITNGSTCSPKSDDIVLTNYELPVATISSSDADNTICAGESVTFTAGAGGTNYEFFVNGVSQQSGASNTYTTTSLQNNEVVTVKVTNANNCSALSTGITMTVHPVPVVTLVSNDADDRICAGSSITFTATPSGASTYNFLVDGVSVQS